MGRSSQRSCNGSFWCEILLGLGAFLLAGCVARQHVTSHTYVIMCVYVLVCEHMDNVCEHSPLDRAHACIEVLHTSFYGTHVFLYLRTYHGFPAFTLPLLLCVMHVRVPRAVEISLPDPQRLGTGRDLFCPEEGAPRVSCPALPGCRPLPPYPLLFPLT